MKINEIKTSSWRKKKLRNSWFEKAKVKKLGKLTAEKDKLENFKQIKKNRKIIRIQEKTRRKKNKTRRSRKKNTMKILCFLKQRINKKINRSRKKRNRIKRTKY
jgi:hypothetical protein